MDREEAIKEMREKLPWLTEDTKRLVEALIPELAESEDESEDERIRKWLYDYIQYCPNNNFAFYGGVGKDAVLNYLEKQKEQKPAEWSEEDEERLKAICTYLQDYPRLAKINDVKRFNEYCDWLKSLPERFNLQPKAELTLLDENIIKAAVAFVGQNNHFNYWGGIDKHTVINALRSLRPSWKPSEEQMEAFSSYIKDFQEKAEAAVGGWNNFDVMIRLYEQLKKL